MNTLGFLVGTCLLASISFGDRKFSNHQRSHQYFAKHQRVSELIETCISLNKGRNPCDCGSVCKLKKKNDLVQNVKCNDCSSDDNNANLVCSKSGTCGPNIDVYRYKSCPPGYSLSEHTGACYFILSNEHISAGFASADEGCQAFGGGKAADILDATENQFIKDLLHPIQDADATFPGAFIGLHNGILNGEVWRRTGKSKGPNTFEDFVLGEEFADDKQCVLMILAEDDSKTWKAVACDSDLYVICKADPMCMPMLEDKCSAKPHYSY